jgi:SAM-dependent methyltransferase
MREVLSDAGEQWGIEWLIYNPLLFAWYQKQARANAPGVIQTLERAFPTSHRYLDVGAGSGAFAAYAQRRGHCVEACEYSWVGRWFSRCQGVRSQRLDLREDVPAALDCSFDLAYCFEVAEHLEPSLGDRLVHFVATQAPVVVFSAAHPGQGGTGHVNEQPQTYWISRFEALGMNHRADLSEQLAAGFRQAGTASWFMDNVMVFERAAQSSGRRAFRRDEPSSAHRTG